MPAVRRRSQLPAVDTLGATASEGSVTMDRMTDDENQAAIEEIIRWIEAVTRLARHDEAAAGKAVWDSVMAVPDAALRPALFLALVGRAVERDTIERTLANLN